jgi:hypothetical protein
MTQRRLIEETFPLLKGRKPVAELRPLPAGRRLGELEEAAHFAADLAAASDPWAS